MDHEVTKTAYGTADDYEMIFKRKSFHMFRGLGDEKLGDEELAQIEAAFDGFARLCPEIRTAIRTVPAGKVQFKHDAEYCILLYSEKKENYLMNAGYLGEQLDLWLVAHGIGSLWFGFGKPDIATFEGLDYVIMIAVRKVSNDGKFRSDLSRVKRKPASEIWRGEGLGIAEDVRYAPSACNSQPWFVENEGGSLAVYRYKKPGRNGILSSSAASYFNRIDVGIFLCILEVCLRHRGLTCTRTLFPDDGGEREFTKSAVYRLAPEGESEPAAE